MVRCQLCNIHYSTTAGLSKDTVITQWLTLEAYTNVFLSTFVWALTPLQRKTRKTRFPPVFSLAESQRRKLSVYDENSFDENEE